MENNSSIERSRNTPQLRFPEFVDDWNIKTLEQVTTKIGDGIHSTPKYNDNGDHYFINGNNLVHGKIEIFETTKKVTESEAIRHNRELNDRTILLSINGTIGNLAFYNNEKVILGKSAAYLNIKNEVDKEFIYNSLKISKTQIFFFSELTGSTIKNLSLKTIRETKIPIPIPPEQTKIATFLTAVDKRINLLQKKKDELTQYKKGIMQQLFSVKTHGRASLRFKDENGDDFPDWEEKKLGDVAHFSKGKGISKSDIIENGTLECIRYGELYTEYNEIITFIKSSTNLSSAELILSETNNVIIPASGETQIDIATASCVMKSGVALGGDLNIIKTQENGIFLSYYLNNAKKHEIANLSQGISVVHLYSSQLKNLKINIPCFHEQQKIANFLSSIDKSIEKMDSQITGSKDFKKGLLQKMFV